MMEFISFCFFSVIEGSGIMALMLTLFRYKIQNYLFQVLLINVIVFLISYLMRSELQIADFVPVATLMILIVTIKPTLDVSYFYSALISTIGFVASAVIQTLILIVLKSTYIVTVENVQAGNTFDSYTLQVVSCLVNVGFSWFLYRKGLGFSFRFLKAKNIWESIFGFATIIASTVTIGGVFYLTVDSTSELIIVAAILILSLTLGINFSINKEKNDDRQFSFKDGKIHKPL